jgi:hypothetical protein
MLAATTVAPYSISRSSRAMTDDPMPPNRSPALLTPGT